MGGGDSVRKYFAFFRPTFFLLPSFFVGSISLCLQPNDSPGEENLTHSGRIQFVGSKKVPVSQSC